MKPKKMAAATRAIHGSKLYPFTGPVSPAIFQTSTYRFKDSQDPMRYAQGDPNVLVYSRYHNPSVQEVEEKIALLEDGESAILFASGMAAITTTIMTLVHAGQEVISSPALYGGTYRFFRDIAPNHNIVVKYFNPEKPEELDQLITPATRMLFLESPTNPTLDLVDIKKCVIRIRTAERRFKNHIIVVVDNTFATCLNQQPFELGADLIVESGTKYLGGHSDLLAGIVVGPVKLLNSIRTTAKYFGGCADPFMAFLLNRSLKTFQLRVQRQNENAMLLARWLERHPRVSRVLYPGLPSHPKYQLAKKQMTGFGGMVTAEIMGGIKKAVKVTDALNVAVNAMSLGGAETLVSIPVYSSHVHMSAEELRHHGVTPGMIRISTGIEGIEDLIEDFRQALAKT